LVKLNLSRAIRVVPPPGFDLRDVISQLLATVSAALRAPQPFMVDQEEAARRCGMSVTTYKKYEKLKLLPPMNAVGRVSVETLRLACLKLDGFTESALPGDPAEAELADWKRRRGKK
jgi:hypothetical protein